MTAEYFLHGNGQSWYFDVEFGALNLVVYHFDSANLDFGHGYCQNLEHVTTEIFKSLPWSRSTIFDHMTMKPGRDIGQMFKKSVVALPPPPSDIGTSPRV